MATESEHGATSPVMVRKNNNYSTLSNTVNSNNADGKKLINVQENKRKNDEVEVPVVSKFTKSSMAWRNSSTDGRTRLTNKLNTTTTGYRNSAEFRSCNVRNRLDSTEEGVTMTKPSTTDNSLLNRQKRSNYNNINDYLQLATLDSLAMDQRTQAMSTKGAQKMTGFSWNKRAANSVLGSHTIYMPSVSMQQNQSTLNHRQRFQTRTKTTTPKHLNKWRTERGSNAVFI